MGIILAKYRKRQHEKKLIKLGNMAMKEHRDLIKLRKQQENEIHFFKYYKLKIIKLIHRRKENERKRLELKDLEKRLNDLKRGIN